MLPKRPATRKCLSERVTAGHTLSPNLGDGAHSRYNKGGSMSSSGITPRQLESGLLNTLLRHPLQPGETQSLLDRLGPRLPSTFEQLATLVYVANQVSSTLDLETLLDRIVSIAKEVTR